MNEHERINKTEALSFLLTHIVVDQRQTLSLDSLSLFRLIGLAQRATDEINSSDDAVPHEILESMADVYLREE